MVFRRTIALKSVAWMLLISFIAPSYAFSSTGLQLRNPRRDALALTSQRNNNINFSKISMSTSSDVQKFTLSLLMATSMIFPCIFSPIISSADAPAQSVLNDAENFKVLKGAASTQDTGTRRTITRGTVLEGGNFEGKELVGISFQQSLCRDCNFKGSNLKGASFFDGDLTQANFEGADLTNVNFEMACLKDANLKNAVVHEAYILGTTKLDGVEIEGADFSDTFLRKDQIKYLCARAKGTNPTTGVSTAESLRCP